MAEAKSAEEYLEAINKAISIHTQKATANLGFNRSEIAEITDVSNKAFGDYVVSNGSAKYHAYSENTTYTVGTKVYVTIQNNDYSSQKLITGKVSAQKDKPIKYVAPLERYNPLTPNLIEIENAKLPEDDELFDSIKEVHHASVSKYYNAWEEGNQEDLLANWNLANSTIVGTEGPYSQYILLYHSKNLQEFSEFNQIFKYLGISADFRTRLYSLEPVTGEYGLDIYLTYSYTINNTDSTRNYETIRYRLSSNDMIGSVYNFNTFYNQQALFELDINESRATTVHYIGIYFYQEGNFKDIENNYLPTHYNGYLLPPNISVKNLGIYFGDEPKGDAIDDVSIYTRNGLFYDSAQLNDKAIEKQIYLKWLHKDYANSTDDSVVYETLTSCNVIDSDADVKLHGRIHWFKSSILTIADYRSKANEDNEYTDELYQLVEKYKNNFASHDEWTKKLIEENLMFGEMSANEFSQAADRYNELLEAYKSENAAENKLSREEMYTLIQELNLTRYKDYYYNEITESYYLTPTGEKNVNNAISRLQKNLETINTVDETLLVADEKDLAGEMWEPLDANVFNVSYLPDRKLSTCAVKCIVEYGPYIIDDEGNELDQIDRSSQFYTRIESNTLDFVNMTAVPDAAGQDLAKGIQITYKDNSNGNYPLYDANAGRILNIYNSTQKRELSADLISRYTGKSYLNGNEILIWKVPKKKTMISVEAGFSANRAEIIDLTSTEQEKQILYTVDENFTLGSEYDLFNDYYYIKWESTSSGVPVNNKLYYWISPYFVKTNTNNTIYCFLYKNNETITGNTTMNFSQKGSCGTDYTFTFAFGELVDNNWNVVGPAEQALTLNSDYWRVINIDLYDGEGNIINLTEDEKNDIIKLWVEHNQKGFYSGYYNAQNLEYITQTTTYQENSNTITKYTKVAVRVKKQTTIENCQFITLSASVTSPSVSTYNNREYKLDNVLFTQYLPVHVRTASEYCVEGSGIIYYDDKGALNQSDSIRYALIGYDEIKYTQDFSPTLQEFKDNVKEIQQKITHTLEEYGINSYVISLPSFNFINRIDKNRFNLLDGVNAICDTFDECLEKCDNELESLATREEEERSNNTLTDIKVKQYETKREGFNIIKDIIPNIQNIIKEYESQANNYYALRTTEEGLFSINPCKWSNNAYTKITNIKELQYYPEFQGNEHILIPCNLLISDVSKEIAINCTLNNRIVYTMPLLMLQNKYQIPALNRWNGKLMIDEDNNQIFAATMAAGHKETDNTYTGIIMGDIGHVENDNVVQTTGLYGYNWGEQSFGLLTDGKAFIGKTGTGRIEFDGNSGTIKSANYNQTYNDQKKSGTLIDLDDGSIDMWGYGVTYSWDEINRIWTTSGTDTGATNIHLDTYGTTSSPYFRIGVPVGNNSGADSDGLKSLIRMDNNNYYLQSVNYGSNSNGLKIDLKEGSLSSFGKLTITAGTGSSINFGGGKLQLTDSSGTIAGWNISENSLYKGHLYINSSENGGSIYSSNWGINEDGTAWFKNVSITDSSTITLGSQGIGYNGISFGNGFASFSGDIYANNGYFSGEVHANKIYVGSEFYIDGQLQSPQNVTFLTGVTSSFSTGEVDASRVSISNSVITTYDRTIYYLKSISLTFSRMSGYILGGVAQTDSVVAQATTADSKSSAGSQAKYMEADLIETNFRLLTDAINEKADKDHNHDDRYLKSLPSHTHTVYGIGQETSGPN